jgi:hypothetical protein
MLRTVFGMQKCLQMPWSEGRICHVASLLDPSWFSLRLKLEKIPSLESATKVKPKKVNDETSRQLVMKRQLKEGWKSGLGTQDQSKLSQIRFLTKYEVRRKVKKEKVRLDTFHYLERR